MRLVAAMLTLFVTLPLAADTPKSETVRLFNGTSLDGWVGYADHWSVKNGEIVGKNTTPVPVSTYLLTERKFRDFHLQFDAKLAESEMHTGVAFWGKVDPSKGKERSQHTYAGHLVMFPKPWGMYDLFGRNLLKDADPKPAIAVGHQHEWNAMELWATGNRVRLVVNGVFVLDWRDPKPERIHEAPIGLQLHSNKVPQEVRFRGLVLTTNPSDDRISGKKIGERVEPVK